MISSGPEKRKQEALLCLSENAQNIGNTSFHIEKEKLSALRHREVLRYR